MNEPQSERLVKTGKVKPEVNKMNEQSIRRALAKSTIGAIALVCCAAALADQVTDLNTFNPGDPALASEVNDNFTEVQDSVNDNDARINVLEGLAGINNQPIAVDCEANANAFLGLEIEDNTTYILTGTCNGPIEIFRKRNVVIEGDPAGVPKDDGIFLPPGLIVNPFAALGVYESNIELRDLTIDATNYVTNSYAFSGSVSAINVGQHAIARIFDVDVEGGDYGIDVFRNAFVKTYQNVNVRNFNLYGVEAWGNSHVEFRDPIEVIGGAATTATWPYAIIAGSNGFIQVQEGGTFTPAGSNIQPDSDSYSIGAYDNGVVQIKENGISTLNGDVEAMRGAAVRILGGAVVTGYLGAWSGGIIRFEASSQSAGVIEAARNSTVRVRGGSTIAGNVGSWASSSIRIQEGSTHSGGDFWAGGGAFIEIQDSVFEGALGANAGAINVWNSTRSGGGDIFAENNSTININSIAPMTLVADVKSTASSSVVLSNISHSGGLFESEDGGYLRIENSTIVGAIDSVNSSTVKLVNVTHSGGNINALVNSNIIIQDTSISGSISARQSSAIDADNVAHSGGDIESLTVSSAFFIASTLDTTGGFVFETRRGSSIILVDSNVTASGPLEIQDLATFQVEASFPGTSDLGSAGYTCHDPNQINIDTNVTNVGIPGC